MNEYRQGSAPVGRAVSKSPTHVVGVTLRSCSIMEHIMSKLFATAAVLAVALCAPAFVTPANARPFCYNKYTGQFAHWGHCRVVCTYYGPGGYCRKVTW
jgi:hypothetical protein